MGDMADLIMMNAPDGYWEDWQSAEDYERFMSKPKTCDYCGMPKLEWKHTDYGWRLHQPNGLVHTCQAYRDAKEAK